MKDHMQSTVLPFAAIVGVSLVLAVGGFVLGVIPNKRPVADDGSMMLPDIATSSPEYVETVPAIPVVPSSSESAGAQLAPTETRKLLIKGSIPYWDQKRAFSAFRENIAVFDYVNVFWYYANEDGGIVRYRDADEDEEIIRFAHEHGVKVFAVVTNLPEERGTTWDSDRIERMMTDRVARKAHIANIVEKLSMLNFDGVTIDYEELKPRLRDNFSLLIKDMSAALHEQDMLLAVALHPKTKRDDEIKGIGAFQNWPELARHADHLNIMAYNEHWDEGSAGPIASVPWVERIMRYAKGLRLPQEKLFLGVPFYGYDWNTSRDDPADGLTHRDVEGLLSEHEMTAEWDRAGQSPHATYEANGYTHEVWFENARSVASKIALASSEHFAGVTFWRLGEEDQSIWEEVKKFR